MTKQEKELADAINENKQLRATIQKTKKLIDREIKFRKRQRQQIPEVLKLVYSRLIGATMP